MTPKSSIERPETISPQEGSDTSRLRASRMIELPRTVCLDLLGSHHFGRLAVAIGGGAPIVRPMNYTFDRSSQSVVFRTSRGSKLYALTHATAAAFEIDGIDEQSQTGWSVIIQGVSEEVVRADELRRLERYGLDPWAPGLMPHWVRIRARTVTGRQVAFAGGAIPGTYLG
ncbi:MAG: pyridoxamine 5'-phosphate oxidase family protein [Solirubrobacteraceae bacterium]